ncbi:hypothetical protein [Kaarinaea lacus]
MNFELKPTFKGITVTNGETNYLYKSKLFSLSAVLEDENGNVLASLKRSGWLHLTFMLWTENESYKVEQKWGEVKIDSLSSEIRYRTNMTIDFYDKTNKRVTVLSRVKKFGLLYKLSIKETEHYLALLMASCMLFKSSLEGEGVGAV